MGGKFQALQSFFENSGIVHRVSCSHTPKKRKSWKRAYASDRNCSFFSTASKHTSKFGTKQFLQLLIQLIEGPRQFKSNTSLFETLFYVLHYHTFFKTFGCLSHTYLRPCSSNNLDQRSEKCLFLGYIAFRHGYGCLSLVSGEILFPGMWLSMSLVFLALDKTALKVF